jgi:hypothetical protein
LYLIQGQCDENVPECSQCLNGGRQCPGAISGMVFLQVVTEEADSACRKKAQRLSLLRDAKLPAPAHGNVFCCFERVRVNSVDSSPEKLDDSDAQLEISQDCSFPQVSCRDLPAQITSQEFFRQQALSHFVDFFAKIPLTKTGVRSWMRLLPDMLSSQAFPAVKIPIVAASVIYLGRLSNQKTVVMEGYKWYGSSLERQRRQLQLSSYRGTPPTAEEICMPIMLSFFEVICRTSPKTYFQHIVGAAKLLDIRGPEACKSGIFHQLFQTVRVQMVPLTGKRYATAYIFP